MVVLTVPEVTGKHGQEPLHHLKEVLTASPHGCIDNINVQAEAMIAGDQRLCKRVSMSNGVVCRGQLEHTLLIRMDA